MAKSFWMADQKGNYSNDKNDTFDENNDYIGVRMQQGVPLLDRDWNELEDNRRYQDLMLRRNYVGDGTPDDGFKISKINDIILDFEISKGRFLVDGIEAVNHKKINYSQQDNPVKLTEPEGVRNDLVYIELKVKEIDGPENKQDVAMATCLRHVVKWAVRVKEGSEKMPDPEQFIWRTPIALLKRNKKDLVIEDRRICNNGFNRDLGDLRVTGNLTVTKATTLSDLSVAKEAKLNGALSVKGNALLMGALSVVEEASLGSLSTERAAVKNTLNIGGTATFNKDLIVNGDTIKAGIYSVLTFGEKRLFRTVIDEVALLPSLSIHVKPEKGSSDYYKVWEISKGVSYVGDGYEGPRTKFFGQVCVESKFAMNNGKVLDSDVARTFLSDNIILPYHVVCISSSAEKIVESKRSDQSRVIGVTSRYPAILASEMATAERSDAYLSSYDAALKILSNKAKDGSISKELFKQFKEGSAKPDKILPHLKNADGVAEGPYINYVAISGITWCSISASNTSDILPGDLLTCDDYGYALKSPDNKPGTIIAKSLGNAPKGACSIVRVLLMHA